MPFKPLQNQRHKINHQVPNIYSLIAGNTDFAIETVRGYVQLNGLK
jgi:hypothetical protein